METGLRILKFGFREEWRGQNKLLVSNEEALTKVKKAKTLLNTIRRRTGS